MAQKTLLSLFVLIIWAALPATNSTAWAQATPDSTAVSSMDSGAESPPKPARDAGVFSKGRVRGSLQLGLGSAFDNSYFLLGVSGGYYLMNGLEIGAELLSWLGQDPTMLQITPELRYVLWQPRRFHPYVGGFFRHTMINNWPDQQSIGGRFGIMYRSGNTYVGIGGVYNHYLDCDDRVFDCDYVYPEVFFSLYF